MWGIVQKAKFQVIVIPLEQITRINGFYAYNAPSL
ncbi:MAG: hypothetical protein ACJAS9_003073 [Polaribacter sp.]|jgi:hypothetical protein